jgi:hypothetical protein
MRALTGEPYSLTSKTTTSKKFTEGKRTTTLLGAKMADGQAVRIIEETWTAPDLKIAFAQTSDARELTFCGNHRWWLVYPNAFLHLCSCVALSPALLPIVSHAVMTRGSF